MSRISKDKATGMFCLLFSLFFIYQALLIRTPPSATQDFLGAKGFPLIIGISMAIISLGILLFSKQEESKDDEKIGIMEIKKLIPYLILISLFIFIVPHIGMFIGFILFSFFMIRFIEKGNIIKYLIVSISVSVGIWIIFDVLLNLSMPIWLNLL